MEMMDIVKELPLNQTIVDNFIKAYSYINRPTYNKIVATISGGADSDVVLDICVKCDKDHKIDYVWFDTGLEYQATKDHLDELEKKYDITIKRIRAKKPIPVSCKVNGEPFISKKVSDYIERLQRHNFKWEDKPFEELMKEYPSCKVALRWWCNKWGEKSRFNISYNKWLKEFMILNPPTFKISNKCCQYAKKDVIHNYIKEENCDLNIYGVRKAEGGQRASAYKGCFDDNYCECDNYRPLFWYKNEDRKDYEDTCGITHSACYTTYGLQRTGCCGCPFGRNFEQELQVLETYEPKLYVAVMNIFKNSIEYTRRYNQFYKEMNERNK